MAPSRSLGVAIGLCVAVSACDQVEQTVPATPPAPVVGVIEAATIEVSPGIEHIGRIEAVDDVDLRARVEGFLLERTFEEGSDVDEGTVLFRIEPDTYKTEIDRIKATAAGTQAELDLAIIERERRRTLVERDVNAQATLDEAIAQEAAARAQLDQNFASLERAELDLSYTEVRAPFDGTIGRAGYSEGDFVGPQSEPLATLVRMDPVFARINVSMRELLRIQDEADEGDYLPYLRLADGSEYPLSGQWSFVEPKVDPRTDTVAVRATFENPDRRLLPGAFVALIARRTEPVKAVAVPQGAIQEDQAGRFSYGDRRWRQSGDAPRDTR